jgi:hypothetical protein
MEAMRLNRRQLGQSMTEYAVVLVFGVMVITTGPGGDMSLQLLQVMKDNYEGYSYGLSLSEAPDYDDVATYDAALVTAGYTQEERDKLAVESSDVFTDLSPYNRDPLRQINAGVNTIRRCANAFPTSVNQLINGPINCP